MTLPPEGYLAMSADILVFKDLGGKWVLLASSVERSEVLLNSRGA